MNAEESAETDRMLTEINEAVCRPDLDKNEIGSLIAQYIAGGGAMAPVHAVWVVVGMAKNMRDLIKLDLPEERRDDPNLKVNIMHGLQYTDNTELDGAGKKASAQIGFALHVVEHLINEEWEKFYNHLLELTVDQDMFMELIAGMIMAYNKLATAESTGHARIKTLLMDENGVETVADRGNTDLPDDILDQ